MPGSKVVQVQARGLDVRYEILSPAPCPLFSIGPGEGAAVRGVEGGGAPPRVVQRLFALPFAPS